MSPPSARELLAATLFYAAISFALTGPALLGEAALGPEKLLDFDLLYRTRAQAPTALPRALDYTPIVLERPRDFSFAQGLHRGRFDAWTQLIGPGAPLWAEYSGPFFPLKLPFYAWPSRPTYDLFLALRLVAAGLGAYWLARYRGLSVVPALAAGAVFELSGALLALLPFACASPPHALPWVILGSFAIARRATLVSVVAPAAALGVAAMGGHPTLALMTLAGFVACALGHLASSWRDARGAASIAGRSALALVLGLALAAPTLLPLVELRNVGTTYKDRAVGTVVYAQALAESRRAFGEAVRDAASLRAMPKAKSIDDHLASVGALASIIAVAGVFTRRLGLPLLAVGTFGITLALAPPVLGMIGGLSPLDRILPKYCWPLFALVLSQSAGEGLGTLDGRKGAQRIAVAFVVLALAAAVLLPASNGLREASISEAVFSLPAAVVMTGLTTYLLLQATRFRRYGCHALLAFMVLEQMLALRPFLLHPVSEVLSMPPSPAVRFLRERLASGEWRMTGIPHRIGHPSSPMLFDLPDIRSVAALQVARLYDYMQAMSPETGDFTVLGTPSTRSRLLDLAAVRYLVLPAPPPAKSLEGLLIGRWPAENDAALAPVYRDENVVVYENRKALPRVRIVHRAEQVPDRATALRRITEIAQRRDPESQLDIADFVLIEPDEDGNVTPARSHGDSPRGSVRLLPEEDPDRLSIEARLDEPGFIVVADTYYPGWKAWVDGTPASIFPANLLFRAIPVAQGAHAIEMRYEPASVRLGLWSFALACFAMAALSIAPRLWRRRSRISAGAVR